MTQYWPRYVYYQTSDYYHRDVYGRLERMRKTLSELQLHSGTKEMQRANSMGALEKPDDEERKERAKREQELTSQLERLRKEMERLRLENEELKSHEEGKEVTSGLEEKQHQNSPSPSDIFFDSTSPPNSPDKQDTQNMWKRLKEAEDRAYQAESRSDELNLLLNYKLIEINKLQLTLSSQTKDLIQLEKAYYQLRCHLHRNRKLPSPSMRRISSKLNKTT